VNAGELDQALAEAPAAILGGRDPAATAKRLRRWARRETEFACSAASLSEEELVAAKCTGIPIQIFSATLRR
jgi:hypothetical protein